MKKLAIFIFTFAFGALSLGYGESSKIDFTGEWQLDKAQSQGLPPGSDQTMTVKQQGERLEVQVKLAGPEGERTLSDTYVVNGEATDFKPPMVGGGGGGTVKSAKRTAKWTSDGKGLDSSEQATIDGPQGEGTVKAKRNWRLSDDGKTLTIEMEISQPDGNVMKSKRVFAKK